MMAVAFVAVRVAVHVVFVACLGRCGSNKDCIKLYIIIITSDVNQTDHVQITNDDDDSDSGGGVGDRDHYRRKLQQGWR